jgi:hypothetical protein
VTAAERARWLGELSDALNDAQNLVRRLGRSGVPGLDALELGARIETVRFQVRSLSLARHGGLLFEQHPEWMKQTLWNGCKLGD